MATFATTTYGQAILDLLSGHSTALAYYSTPPTKAGGGTEVQRVLFSLDASTDGTAGRTAQRIAANVLFLSVPSNSSGWLGLAILDDDTDEILAVKDDWTPVGTYSIGDNMLVDALTVFTKN